MADVKAESVKGLALLEQRLSAKSAGPGGVGFDPMMIITLLLTLLGNCPNPFAATLRRKPLNVARVRAGLRQQGLSWAEAREVAEHLFELADDATDDELQELIRDCCG